MWLVVVGRLQGGGRRDKLSVDWSMVVGGVGWSVGSVLEGWSVGGPVSVVGRSGLVVGWLVGSVAGGGRRDKGQRGG